MANLKEYLAINLSKDIAFLKSHVQFYNLQIYISREMGIINERMEIDQKLFTMTHIDNDRS
jgi:hypothetical protein